MKPFLLWRALECSFSLLCFEYSCVSVLIRVKVKSCVHSAVLFPGEEEPDPDPAPQKLTPSYMGAVCSESVKIARWMRTTENKTTSVADGPQAHELGPAKSQAEGLC